MERHLQAKDPSTRYRAPYGFGAAPGPRQPLGLQPVHGDIQTLRKSCPERFTSYAVRFRSSRTFLETLLPPGFAFTSPATVVRASIETTTLDGMTWLGGSGYSLVRLSLHGINYTKRDGSKVFGSYTPVLFENLADPIITGRDDVGFPKLFADIGTSEDGVSGNVAISIKWRDTEFGRIDIKGLVEERVEDVNGHAEEQPQPPRPGPPSPPPEQGDIVYRYVPAVGEPGKADAKYAVLCPHPAPRDRPALPSKRIAQDAKLTFSAGDWRTLPTLHHVTAKLAEMPVYGIEKAEKISGFGMNDLSNAVKIE